MAGSQIPNTLQGFDASDTSTLTSFFQSQNFTPTGTGNGPNTLDTLSYAYSSNLQAEELPVVGTQSLFNPYAIFRYETAAGNVNILHDVQGHPGISPLYSKNPTAGSIIQWSQDNGGQNNPVGAMPYSYSDFLYCKYYGRIPNNALITLRRYPFPMPDNLKNPNSNNIPPVAQIVTWFGEETGNSLKDVFKFTLGQNWKEIEAQVQNVTGNEKGFDDSVFAAIPGAGALKGALGFLNPNEYSGLSQAQSDYSKHLYEDGPYANKVYGPVNVISKTFARDRGLHFEQEFSLNFHYKLSVYGNINPKVAMLDLLANILTLTYNNAKFWGGAIRYFPQYPRVKMIGDQKEFYAGHVDKYIDSVVKDFSSLGDTFMKTFTNLLTNPMAVLEELAKGGEKMLMGNIAARNRPEILSMRSLLTGDPVGEWHLTIGNPMNPIALIGNLICTDCEFEFNDELGADDFPTEMKVNIKLKHGRPRDKGDIESMFNLGNGRMYYGIQDQIFSSTHNSIVDTSGTKGSNNAGKSTDTSKVPAQTTSEAANTIPIGDKTYMGNMWGNKFNTTELGITKPWTGSNFASVTPKAKQ